MGYLLWLLYGINNEAFPEDITNTHKRFHLLLFFSWQVLNLWWIFLLSDKVFFYLEKQVSCQRQLLVPTMASLLFSNLILNRPITYIIYDLFINYRLQYIVNPNLLGLYHLHPNQHLLRIHYENEVNSIQWLPINVK